MLRHLLWPDPADRRHGPGYQGVAFVTRPALADYIADPAERAALARELFGHVESGRITIEVSQRYQLEDAVQAHRDLEGGRTVGSSVFCP